VRVSGWLVACLCALETHAARWASVEAYDGHFLVVLHVLTHAGRIENDRDVELAEMSYGTDA
jgi:hypothetical protein